MTRTERRSAARKAAAEAACQEAQEILTEELEERLRKHWPRKGRTEVIVQTIFLGQMRGTIRGSNFFLSSKNKK